MGDYLTSFPENSKYIVSLDHFKQKQKGTNLYLKLYCSLRPTQTKIGMEYLWWMTGSKALPSETLSLEILGNKMERQKTK